MSDFKPMIGIYIPSITYTSVGPGFVDAMKLEARNLYLPEKKYKVYTKYTSNESKTECVYAYRQVIGARVDTPTSCNPVTSVQYSDDSQRCQYGYFYDYISSDPNASDGGLNHTLTCFSNTSKIGELESFTINDKDGIYVIESDEADAAIELIFTFYTLSYDKYDHKNNSKPEDTMAMDVHSCPQDYIEIGTMTKIVRASTLGQNEEADMVAEDELLMYYEITKKDDDAVTLYLPVGGDFKPVVGLESDSPKVVKSGNTIFDEYEEVGNLTSETDWGDPIVIDITKGEQKQSLIERGCLSVYVPKTIDIDGHNQALQREYIASPTLVDINTQQTNSVEISTDLQLTDLSVEGSTLLWSSTPTYAVQNLTHKKNLLNSKLNYAPCAIIEYMPDLEGILFPVDYIHQGDKVTINTSCELEDLYYCYAGSASSVGRGFAYALSTLPHTKYNIKNYIANFGFERGGDVAKSFFVSRPSYLKDQIDSNQGILGNDEKIFLQNLNVFNGKLLIDGYAVDATQLFNGVAGWASLQTVSLLHYPLNVYFTNVEVAQETTWRKQYKPDTYYACRFYRTISVPEFEEVGYSEISPTLTIGKSFYQHIFTTSDLQNLPNILGETKLYTSDYTIPIHKMWTQTSIPIMDVCRRWPYGDVYTVDGITDLDLSNKQPAHQFYPVNDYPRMLSWADSFSITDMSKSAGSSAETKDFKDYEQKLVLSPMFAIDMDESNTTLSNKGDYKVIPAYYYGDADDPDVVITDYKNLMVNIKEVSGLGLNVASDAIMPSDLTSTFINYDDGVLVPLPYPLYYSGGSSATVTVEIDRQSSFESGLYVLKFQKYFTSGDRPSLKSLKLKYTYNSKNYTSNYDFIVLMINEDWTGSQIDVTFSVTKDVHAWITNFALYQVDMSNNKNLNQVLLAYWYQLAKSTSLGTGVSIVPDNDSDPFYKLLYDNIIFPSAVCAYENFTLFPMVDGGVKNGFTKSYKAAYFTPNPMYNIIGLYNIQNTSITLVDDLPDDIKVEELICYNQPSRYV